MGVAEADCAAEYSLNVTHSVLARGGGVWCSTRTGTGLLRIDLRVPKDVLNGSLKASAAKRASSPGPNEALLPGNGDALPTGTELALPSRNGFRSHMLSVELLNVSCSLHTESNPEFDGKATLG